MEETLKKLIYTGVGFISLAAKNFENAIKDLQEKGSLSDEEGERIINEFKKEAGNSKEEAESEFRQFLDRMLDKLDVARKKEIEDLKARIELLEEKLKEQNME